MTWSAEQYLKFEDERTRPARDLLAQIPLDAAKIAYDLGCGPGNSTELVAARFPTAKTIGVDSDDDMLATARKRLPDLTFEKADVAKWQPSATVDLLFANAVFQWIPDHIDVLVRLVDGLSKGGVLAVQMPDNLGEPTHLLMEEVARSAEFSEDFAGKSLRRTGLPRPETYFDHLSAQCQKIDVWHTIYYHRLENASAIVEWVKGTGLRPYLNVLPETRREAYLASYLSAVTRAYPTLADGSVLLKFPRLFLVAIKS